MPPDRDGDYGEYSIRDAIDNCASRRQVREVLEVLEGLSRSVGELTRHVAKLEKPPAAVEPVKDELAPWAAALVAKMNGLADGIAKDPDLVGALRAKVLNRLGVKPAANGAKAPFLPHDPDD